MKYGQEAENLFEQALAAFPYQLDPTSITQGNFEGEAGEDIECGEEFTFEVGRLLDEKLIAGGWIEYCCYDTQVTITAFFGIARNGDWQESSILGEYEALQGEYDLETKRWNLQIDTY